MRSTSGIRAQRNAAACALYNGKLKPFHPLVRNAHLLTILGNFWPRTLDIRRFPVKPELFDTEPGVQVLVYSQDPAGTPQAELILVHGLEGSSEAGYALSMTQAALEAGYAVHRFNMRSCGGTEILASSNYHAGQTGDLLAVARQIFARRGLPLFLIGFSLGGNVVLKLAGELGEDARGWIAGVCGVSTPIDLAACVKLLERRANFLYQWRFLSRLKQRIRTRHQLDPKRYSVKGLDTVSTIFEFDDVYTAQFFGFGGAANYYWTQSARQFLDLIRVPALLIQAKDDPLIPFEVFDQPAFARNSYLRLLAVEHGGHLGFLSLRHPRFWLDHTVLEWVAATVAGKNYDTLRPQSGYS
ncbi:MAG TPA: alpha/beta fold hydrolase [Bryobacteraceae bacterium]|nr:alpha/beta fold hydrolase [Bryobacteraceae bacterium]